MTPPAMPSRSVVGPVRSDASRPTTGGQKQSPSEDHMHPLSGEAIGEEEHRQEQQKCAMSHDEVVWASVRFPTPGGARDQARRPHSPPPRQVAFWALGLRLAAALSGSSRIALLGSLSRLAAHLHHLRHPARTVALAGVTAVGAATSVRAAVGCLFLCIRVFRHRSLL
jgi:hypothetical protein